MAYHPNDGKILELLAVSPEEAVEMVCDSKITHGPTCLLLLGTAETLRRREVLDIGKQRGKYSVLKTPVWGTCYASVSGFSEGRVYGSFRNRPDLSPRLLWGPYHFPSLLTLGGALFSRIPQNITDYKPISSKGSLCGEFATYFATHSSNS